MELDDWKEMVHDITTACDLGIRVGGLGQRIAPAGTASYPGALNSRVYTNTYYDLRDGAIDPTQYDWVGVDWPVEEFCPEDFHMQCQLVREGEVILNWNKYASGGNQTQAKGGCSTTRTLESHNAGMIRFADIWSSCSTLGWKEGWEDGKDKATLKLYLSRLAPYTKAEMLNLNNTLRSKLNIMSKEKAKELEKAANKKRQEDKENDES